MVHTYKSEPFVKRKKKVSFHSSFSLLVTSPFIKTNFDNQDL